LGGVFLDACIVSAITIDFHDLPFNLPSICASKAAPAKTFLQQLMPLIFFNHFENSHSLKENGFLSEKYWRVDSTAIRYHKAQNHQNWHEYSNQQKNIFRPFFAENVDAIVQN
jgi:hypothetical protein